MRGYHVATLILAYTAACTTSDRVTDVFLVHLFHSAYFPVSIIKEQRRVTRDGRDLDKEVLFFFLSPFFPFFFLGRKGLSRTWIPTMDSSISNSRKTWQSGKLEARKPALRLDTTTRK